MSDTLLPCVELEPDLNTPATHTVLLLHGLGADGNDFAPIVPHLGLPDDLAVRFVFPHAPSIPVTLNGGFVMPAWYDIRDTDLRNRHDEDGIRKTAVQIEQLLAREYERGVPSENVILAGFSQGGAMALHVGIRHAKKLAGIVALSTYLVCDDSVADERSEANRGVSIFQGHGTQDPMVTLSRGQDAYTKLQDLGYTIAWNDYPMEHSVCPEEIADIGQWLNARFGQSD